MLKFCLSDNIIGESWQTENCRWKCGQSFIEPFDHIALENFSFAGDSQMIFIIRERLNGYSYSTKPPLPEIKDINGKHASDIIYEMDKWPLNFIIIRLFIESDNLKVSIKNGAWATAPIFLTVSKVGLQGDWDAAMLYPHLQTRHLDEIRLAHFLAAFETPYSARTIFSEMYMLTERATAKWESKNKYSTLIRIDYPKGLQSPTKQTLKPGADVLTMFEKIMSQSIDRWLTPEAHVVCELSSGLDSGVVAAICSTISNKTVHTCGILVPGEEGLRQQHRRNEMIDRFGYVDYSVAAENYPPLTIDSFRIKNNLIIPWEECYYEAMDQLLLQYIQPGKTIMFTGVGGDELFFPHWDELNQIEKDGILNKINIKDLKVPEFINKKIIEKYLISRKFIEKAPRSLIPTSSKEASAYGGARYLRRGVWPVDPFCTQEVIWFCRSLPKYWRNNRMLERKFLAKKGCSEFVTFPKSTESFTPFMESSLRGKSSIIIRQVMQNSVLAQNGNINLNIFLQLYSDYCNGKEIDRAAVFFYSTAIMELTLQYVDNKIAINHLLV
jgi:asparagine synthase (glutamine-hydrolysing)